MNLTKRCTRITSTDALSTCELKRSAVKKFKGYSMQIIQKRNVQAGYKVGFCLLIFISFFISAEQVLAFEFDGIQSGLTVRQFLDLAQQRDLDVFESQKHGIRKGHFNALLFKDTSKIKLLTYYTDLLGERVAVELQFTPQTQRLFFIKSNIKATPKYLEGLTSALDKKYGDHKKSYGLIFTLQNSTYWNVSERTEIKIVKNMSLYSLQYTDPSFLKLNEKEKATVALAEKKDLPKLSDDKL
jgi:hypothetical protein